MAPKKIRPELIAVRGHYPVLGSDCFIADNARVIGDVQMGDSCSIWYNVTIRGDVMPIRIGKEVNIQDGTVLHGTYGKVGCEIGDRVTIGHLAMIHGAKVGAGTLIGMGSILMDSCVIGEHSIVAAGSLVKEGSVFPARSLIMGRPAIVKKQLSDEDIDILEKSADNYLLYKTWYEKI